MSSTGPSLRTTRTKRWLRSSLTTFSSRAGRTRSSLGRRRMALAVCRRRGPSTAGRYDGTPLGGYARQWLANVGGTRSWYQAAVDPGGAARSLADLPLDYYAPGPGFLYAKSGWSASASALNLQLGALTGVGHAQL